MRFLHQKVGMEMVARVLARLILLVLFSAWLAGAEGGNAQRGYAAYACRGEEVELSCCPDKLIKIIRAYFVNYPPERTLNKTQQFILMRCDELNSCRIPPPKSSDLLFSFNSNFSYNDPCGQEKNLAILFKCVTDITAEDNGSMQEVNSTTWKEILGNEEEEMGCPGEGPLVDEEEQEEAGVGCSCHA